MTRVPASLDATPFREGRDAFAALLAEIGARGWAVEQEHDQPYFGPVWIVAPHGEFCGHGFGRLDSARIAYRKALEGMR